MAQYARTEERARILDLHPDYAVDVRSAAGRFTAEVDGARLADSERALEVQESFHDPVVYFPPGDVDFARLERTDHVTHCPFKGDASYFTVVLDDGRLENAVWVYETPMAEVAGLAGHLAFYVDRVRVRRGD